MMGRGLYAKLFEHMIAQADCVGNTRQDRAERGGFELGNNLVATPEQCRLMHINGARGERAGKVIFDEPGHPIVWNKGLDGPFRELPDLGDFIDVKTMWKDHHQLLVEVPRLHKEWAYLCVSSENHPYYWIAGWLWGHELLQLNQKRFPARPAYSATVAQLHKPYLLQRIVRDSRPFD
jgi:hypothetical protein